MILLSTMTASAQTILKRPANIARDSFIVDYLQTFNLSHEVIQTTFPEGIAYIYFSDNTLHETSGRFIPRENKIVAYSMTTQDKTTFIKVVIDTLLFENNSETCVVEAAFFANCDEDPEDEMLVILPSHSFPV